MIRLDRSGPVRYPSLRLPINLNTSLHLTLSEYDQMIVCGAFAAIDRKVELIRGHMIEMHLPSQPAPSTMI